MKKTIYFSVIFLGIVAGISAVHFFKPVATLQSKAEVLPAYTVVSSPTPRPPVYKKPLKLMIPKLGISSDIEEVGLDKSGAMDVPKKVEHVGWYALGVKPGDIGNSVIAGHLDDVAGKPAVFYHLSDLKAGDTISLLDSANKKLEFVVEAVTSYPTDEFPMSRVFGETHKRRLNLITCDGTFNRSKNLYSQRLVVYTTLL